MNINYKKQSQFELFSQSSSKNKQSALKPGFRFLEITLSLDNIIVMFIVIIMISVLFFSFGVERGKKIVKKGPSSQENVLTEKVDSSGGSRKILDESQKNDMIFPPAQSTKTNNNQEESNPKQDSREVPEHNSPLPADFKDTYTVQVASFRLKINAQKEADSLAYLGYDTFVVPKGKYSIVCVGKFNRKLEANILSRRLKERYIDCLIRRL